LRLSHPSPPLIVSAHQAVRVAAPDASGAPIHPIELIAANDKQFVRALPPVTLDLVDIVAGGSGLTARRNRNLNPTNGCYEEEPHGQDNKIALPKRPMVFKSDHEYHRVPSNPLIDGVFIVDGGKGPMPLDSAGHIFADFPRNSGDTSALILTPARPSDIWWDAVPSFAKYSTIDYSTAGHGILMMTMNKGITFDLEAIRKAHPQYNLISFSAVVQNSCPPQDNGTQFNGNFWVFVDGELRLKKQRITAASGSVPISVPIAPSSRYLTLATTDDNGDVWGKWLMFGDPILVVEEAAKDKATKHNN
jgi:hypothetical protein